MDYLSFLQTKIEIARESGFDVDGGAIHPVLLPHQRAIVQWAAKGGRRALFESFGLGKSIQQLELLRLICEREDGRGLIVAPASTRDDIWDDINRMKTLNTAQSMKGRALHVCPLQLDIVERLITRYSNPGDVVYDPFGGLGTVAYVALKLRRQGIVVELNTDYFRDAVGYLRRAEAETRTPTLFDFEEVA